MSNPGFENFIPLFKKSHKDLYEFSFESRLCFQNFIDKSQREEEHLVLINLTNFKSHFSQGGAP
jgi:hypothetical protein